MKTHSSATTLLDPEAAPVRKALARSAIYHVLATACAYPSEERLRRLVKETYPDAEEGASDLPKPVRSALERVGGALSGQAPGDVRSEHHQLFGHMPLPDCPAYETGYLGSSVFRQAQAMADIAGFYRAFGLKASGVERERVDHLTVELEFMRFLTFKQAVALVHHGRASADVCRRAQGRFWGDHLGRWLPVFAGLLVAKNPGGYFGAVASLLNVFARSEAAVLGKAEPATQLTTESPMFAEMECTLADGACPVFRGDKDG